MKVANKKKILRMSLLITMVLAVLLSVSYAFMNLTMQGSRKQVIKAGTLRLYLDEGEEVTIENAYPLHDEVGMLQDGFKFTLSNEDTQTIGYKISLVKVEQEDELSTDVVRYSLERDGSIVSGPDSITTLAANSYIVDEGNIKKNTEYSYVLKLWIDIDVTDSEEINEKSMKFKTKVETKEIENEDIILAATLDGNPINNFPTKEDNYGVESVDCDNNAIGTFKTSNWSFVVENFTTTGTTCTANFLSTLTPDTSDTVATTTKEEYVVGQQAISNAITSLGVTVPEGATLEEMASIISSNFASVGTQLYPGMGYTGDVSATIGDYSNESRAVSFSGYLTNQINVTNLSALVITISNPGPAGSGYNVNGTCKFGIGTGSSMTHSETVTWSSGTSTSITLDVSELTGTYNVIWEVSASRWKYGYTISVSSITSQQI